MDIYLIELFAYPMPKAIKQGMTEPSKVEIFIPADSADSAMLLAANHIESIQFLVHPKQRNNRVLITDKILSQLDTHANRLYSQCRREGVSTYWHEYPEFNTLQLKPNLN